MKIYCESYRIEIFESINIQFSQFNIKGLNTVRLVLRESKHLQNGECPNYYDYRPGDKGSTVAPEMN